MRGRVALLVNPASHPPDASSLETVGVRLHDFVLPDWLRQLFASTQPDSRTDRTGT